jgi:uncharacterized membrane protein YfcA
MLSDTLWLTLLLAAAVAALAGAIASVSGFGIGSLLAPVLAVRAGTKLAVAAVSLPHLAATALRFWPLRKHVDRRLLWGFGLMSAAGGLAGALLHAYADNPALTVRAARESSKAVVASVHRGEQISTRKPFRSWTYPTVWPHGFCFGWATGTAPAFTATANAA